MWLSTKCAPENQAKQLFGKGEFFEVEDSLFPRMETVRN